MDIASETMMIAPGDPAPACLEEVTAFAVTILGEPVAILVPHWTATAIGQDGTLVAADIFETAVRGAGARPLTDLNFAGGPVSGWLVSLALDGRVLISGPGAIGELYAGDLPTSTQWLQLVRERRNRGLVVVTVAARPTIDAALEMMAAGHASWIRADVEM